MRVVGIIGRSMGLLMAAVAAGLAPGSASAAGQVLLIGRAPSDVVGLTRLWVSLETGLGFSEVRIAVAGSPHEIADDLRQFLGAPGGADDLRLVWLAGSGGDAATSVCPDWSEPFVRPQVPTILVAPTCVKFLVQAPSTYEQLASVDDVPVAGPPGVVFISTTSGADDDPAELLAALTGSATPQGDQAAARALIGALTCAPRSKLSVDYSPSSSAWHITPPLCAKADAAPEAPTAPTEPAPAAADAALPAETASLPFPPPARPDPEAGAADAVADVPQMPAVPPVPVAAAPLPAVGAPSFVSPVDGKVVADFGSRVAGKPDKGVDFEAPAGSAVKAAESGQVVYVGELPGYGKVIAIKHGSDWATVYGHTSDISVAKGQMVTKGQDIARVDPAGNRLHFEVRRQGRPVDPRPMMASASP